MHCDGMSSSPIDGQVTRTDEVQITGTRNAITTMAPGARATVDVGATAIVASGAAVYASSGASFIQLASGATATMGKSLISHSSLCGVGLTLCSGRSGSNSSQRRRPRAGSNQCPGFDSVSRWRYRLSHGFRGGVTSAKTGTARTDRSMWDGVTSVS